MSAVTFAKARQTSAGRGRCPGHVSSTMLTTYFRKWVDVYVGCFLSREIDPPRPSPVGARADRSHTFRSRYRAPWRASRRALVRATPRTQSQRCVSSRFHGYECENLGDGKEPWLKAHRRGNRHVLLASHQGRSERPAHSYGPAARTSGAERRCFRGELSWRCGSTDPAMERAWGLPPRGWVWGPGGRSATGSRRGRLHLANELPAPGASGAVGHRVNVLSR